MLFGGFMKILSIGNSFSQDAQRYLAKVARARGVKMKTVNLYIGGCTLRTHYLNMLNDARAYDFQFNGESTGLKTSIREALCSDEWDYITLQQASHKSFDYSTYTPYLEALAEYVRKYCPTAKILMHSTWAYEDGSPRLANVGYESAEEMLTDASLAYEMAARDIAADGVIPSGRAMMKALELGIEKIHRDTFHASLGAGRYLLALVWLGYLTGEPICSDDFLDLDEPITPQEREIVIEAAKSVL